eukprot:4916933-Alexandrium_andersonii.AAC.1
MSRGDPRRPPDAWAPRGGAGRPIRGAQLPGHQRGRPPLTPGAGPTGGRYPRQQTGEAQPPGGGAKTARRTPP